jgi:hypothetical protein
MSKPRRFVRAVGVINPRERTAADPHDSNLMSKSDMKRAAKYLAGKPIKFYHESQVLGSSKEFTLGKVLECFENDGRLLCHFEINRDENNPIEFFTGSQVLQGLLNGLSASTRALRNKDTDEIITNCADPAWLKATGSSNSDPGLEVSLCSRDDAARGTGCAILYATEWQKNPDGTVQHLGNVFQPEQQKVDELLSSDADIYKHCAEQAIGEKSSSSILTGHSSFEPLVVQACKERKISANSMSNPETPSSSSSSSALGTPAPPTTSAPTPSPPVADESRKRSETVDASDKDDNSVNHKDKRPATEDKRPSSDDAQDSTAALMARLEYLEKAHAEAVALQKKTEEDAKRQQFEQKRSQLKSVIESVIGDYQKMLEEGGKNPEEDKFFMSFKNVDKVDNETQLGHLGNAVELTQACTLPWRQARVRLEEIQKRDKEDLESQRRREERQRKIEEARLKIAEVNAQNSRASFVQPPSSSGGGYQDPFAALAGLSRNADLNRMSNVPQADSMAKSLLLDQQKQQQQQQNEPSQTPEDPRMKFFEKTPAGSWALKPPQIIAPCYSTDRCLASTPGTLCADTPSTLMSREATYAGAVPTSYDHGMQGQNPARFMEILQSCVSQPPSGIPERIPEYMLRNMLFPRAPVS